MQQTDAIRTAIGKQARYEKKIAAMNAKIHDVFFVAGRGIYRDFIDTEHYSEFGNALAVLCGAASREFAQTVCECIVGKGDELVSASLSTASFVYDALLKTDKDRYAEFVLEDIDKKYGYMLQKGATSFWETLEGERDFGGAGSLCHGWSAMPVYYYHILCKAKKVN